MPTLTYAQALNEALREEMRVDPRVFLMGEDIGHHGGIFRVTKDLIDEFGADRIRDTPISESSFVGLGIGAAMTGMRPVVELLFMDFALVAADQIVNQAAKLRYMSGGTVSVPIVVRAQQGGGRGNGAQHSQSFESWLAQVPGLIIVAPPRLQMQRDYSRAVSARETRSYLSNINCFTTPKAKCQRPIMLFPLVKPISNAMDGILRLCPTPGHCCSRWKQPKSFHGGALKPKSSTYGPSSRSIWIPSSNRSGGRDVCLWYMSRTVIVGWVQRSLSGWGNRLPIG